MQVEKDREAQVRGMNRGKQGEQGRMLGTGQWLMKLM